MKIATPKATRAPPSSPAANQRRVENCRGVAFGEAAVACVKKCKFPKIQRDGKPTRYFIYVEICCRQKEG